MLYKNVLLNVQQKTQPTPSQFAGHQPRTRRGEAEVGRDFPGRPRQDAEAEAYLDVLAASREIPPHLRLPTPQPPIRLQQTETNTKVTPSPHPSPLGAEGTLTDHYPIFP